MPFILTLYLSFIGISFKDNCPMYMFETRVGVRGYGFIIGKFPVAVETKLPRRAKPKARAEAGYIKVTP